jgi:hypothetical protein
MKERFEALAEAYGGDISRWPDELREEASLLATQDPDFARAVLAREARLDAALHELPRAAASADLFERIVATAPPLRRRGGWRLWLGPAGLGAALAGVAAAGVLLGMQISGGAAATGETASAQSVAALDVSTVSEES